MNIAAEISQDARWPHYELNKRWVCCKWDAQAGVCASLIQHTTGATYCSHSVVRARQSYGGTTLKRSLVSVGLALSGDSLLGDGVEGGAVDLSIRGDVNTVQVPCCI